ncbi:hypothetical protein L6452_20267 [Arctium lappa]|uniref:Uncharacterized protein n=1 Tax=Arctium lappa TaxID=4217 RepID=A0ACB9BBN5_ARCLA|nr:hypothetical protein L6452_20267 [Arctium lappa]
MRGAMVCKWTKGNWMKEFVEDIQVLKMKINPTGEWGSIDEKNYNVGEGRETNSLREAICLAKIEEARGKRGPLASCFLVPKHSSGVYRIGESFGSGTGIITRDKEETVEEMVEDNRSTRGGGKTQTSDNSTCAFGTHQWQYNRVVGIYKGKDLRVVIDDGSTGHFLETQTARMSKVKMQETPPYLNCSSGWFQGGIDAVLGVQWPQTFDFVNLQPRGGEGDIYGEYLVERLLAPVV